MQISSIPNGAWTNPAASAQQASNETRSHSAMTTPASNASPAQIDGLEKSNETTDRDANEQYNGSPSDRRRESKEPESSDERESLLSLPACNDADSLGLDLMG
ncbi:MAG: hypothetical protein FJ308_04815 [Planctomycetes bacterium]|nr:hypothetical protein [Planctomycetota bacterium]